jgi:hypothetical protein
MQERRAPLLPALMPAMDGKLWLASSAAVAVFETLLAMFGGAHERDNWHAVRQRLRVCDPGEARYQCVPNACCAPCCALPARVKCLHAPLPSVPHYTCDCTVESAAVTPDLRLSRCHRARVLYYDRVQNQHVESISGCSFAGAAALRPSTASRATTRRF